MITSARYPGELIVFGLASRSQQGLTQASAERAPPGEGVPGVFSLGESIKR